MPSDMGLVRGWLAVSGVYGFFAVALGAFGAHALKARLDEYSLGVFKTGVEYQMFHALGIGLVAFVLLFRGDSAVLRGAAWCFAVGVIIFSGSLYTLALTGVKMWGAITPIGGVLFLAGWLALVVGVLRA